MATSIQKNLRLAYSAITLVIVVGSGAYLAGSGARPGAPLVFLLLGAIALAATMWLLTRIATALLSDPEDDEVRVASGRRKKELEREKHALLKALKEIDFDHQMRKISDGDYKEIAQNYRARAVRVMRMLDESGDDYRRLAEREVATRVMARAEAAAGTVKAGSVADGAAGRAV